MIVAALIGVTSASQSDDSVGSSKSATQAITGSLDDWLSSVCAPGMYFDGTNLSGPIGGGSCSGKDARKSFIFVLQYNSDFKMRNDLVALQMQYYASAISDAGNVTVFAVNSAGVRDSLLPLAKFGFTVQTVSN